MKADVITSRGHHGTYRFPCEPRVGDVLWFCEGDEDFKYVITKRDFMPIYTPWMKHNMRMTVTAVSHAP